MTFAAPHRGGPPLRAESFTLDSGTAGVGTDGADPSRNMTWLFSIVTLTNTSDKRKK
jgi:hypothetical protein